MEKKLQEIADRKWAEMIRAINGEGADVAFDVFMAALREAQSL